MPSAPSPISVRKTLSTVAKIGLSMKLWVTARSCVQPVLSTLSSSALPVGSGVVVDGTVLRRDLAAGNGAHQPVDNNALAGFQAGLDHPQSAAKFAGGDDLRFHRAIRADRHHQMLRLVGHD